MAKFWNTRTWKKITREQLEEIELADDLKERHKLLEKYTGIIAMPYTGYSYYDNAGNYLGNSEVDDVMDLLQSAYIKVEG